MTSNDENAPPNTNDFQENTNKVLMYEGHSFNQKNTAKKHSLYYCKNERSKGCPVKLKKFNDNRIEIFGGQHSEGCLLGNGVQSRTLTTNDYTVEMTEMVEEMALSHLELRPKEIWRQISTEMNNRSPLWRGLTDKVVLKMVAYTRDKAHGGGYLLHDRITYYVHGERFAFSFFTIQCMPY